jgi:hypothetical protein
MPPANFWRGKPKNWIPLDDPDKLRAFFAQVTGMIPNPNLRFVPDSYVDRMTLVRSDQNCFDDLVVTLANLTTYMFTADTIRSGVPPTIGPNFPFTINANTTEREYTFFPMQLVWAISHDQWVESLDIYVDVDMERTTRGELRNEGHQEVVRRNIGSSFIRYFETSRPTVISLAGSQPNDWPEPWDFARILRNAFAHGGIHFDNPSAAPVTWRSIQFGPDDNGTDPLFPYVGLGDLVDLYIELDNALEGSN